MTTISAPAGPVWVASDTWVVARRHLLRVLHRPDELLGTLLIPVMAIGMFGFVFGDAFGASMDVPGSTYREFLMPGLFALTMAFGIGSTTIAVAEDVRSGVLDRMRALSVAPAALLAGRSLADVLVALVELAILVPLGTVLGWSWHGWWPALAGVGLLVLLRVAFSWIGIVLGLLVSGPEAAMKYFALVFPLAMVADTVLPAALMPHWLVLPAAWNPLSSTVIAARDLFGNPGVAGTTWVADHALPMALAWPVAIVAVCVPLALTLLRRMGR